MPPFIDANILVYRYSDDPRRERARAILLAPWQTSIQALNEFALASRRKLKLEWPDIEHAIADLLEFEPTIHMITLATHLQAIRIAQRYRLRFYDAVMIAAALLADAETFLSEDLQEGLRIDNKLTIVNPFA